MAKKSKSYTVYERARNQIEKMLFTDMKTDKAWKDKKKVDDLHQKMYGVFDHVVMHFVFSFGDGEKSELKDELHEMLEEAIDSALEETEGDGDFICDECKAKRENQSTLDDIRNLPETK